VLVCCITTANRLSYVLVIEYKNEMWCTFQVDPTFVSVYVNYYHCQYYCHDNSVIQICG